MARKEIGILMGRAAPMHYCEIVLLKLQGPACNLGIQMFGGLQPSESAIVRDYGEVTAVQVGTELLDGPDNGEALEF